MNFLVSFRCAGTKLNSSWYGVLRGLNGSSVRTSGIVQSATIRVQQTVFTGGIDPSD